MKQVYVTEANVADAVLSTLESNVVMVQMPTVFVLLAPPTEDGVRRLDRTKTRLANKNYGTALGDLDAFHAMADPDSLPEELSATDGFKRLTGAFIRVSVAPPTFASPLVRQGTHQGLLLEGPHRELFKQIEAGLHDIAEPEVIGGHVFTAPLCTSANVSGHPEGSITSWEKAEAFGDERSIPLVVRCEPDTASVGSYPIFWLQRDRIRVEREGPGLDGLRAALPARLFLID